MKTKQQIEKEIHDLEIELREILDKEEAEKNKVNWYKVGNYEYETKDHDFDKKLPDITIPKGCELWNYEDCIKLHNDPELRKILNLEDCWFFIQQPFEYNKLKKYVAGFGADSDWAYLDCNRLPTGAGSSLWVRFKRKTK